MFSILLNLVVLFTHALYILKQIDIVCQQLKTIVFMSKTLNCLNKPNNLKLTLLPQLKFQQTIKLQNT